MIAGDFLQRSDGCRVNAVRNKVVLGGGYTCACMHCGKSICNMVVFSGSVLSGTGKGHKNVFPSPELLAAQCTLHEGE